MPPGTQGEFDGLPAVCQIRDWTVFGPGLHKGKDLYTPQMCARVPPNFRLLRNYYPPVVKLGHDRNQKLRKRLEQSLGFLSLGDVADVTAVGGGRFAVTLTNVPTAIGAQVNAGRIRSGSVELIPHCDDPRDPSKRIAGPILTGLSLLGEEHPAVKGFKPPHAVFADGTPVPPARDQTPWLEAMAEVMSAGFSESFEAGYRRPHRITISGRSYATQVVCFSEMRPMLTADQLQAVPGLKPEQIEEILALCGGEAGGAAPGAPTDTPIPAIDAPPAPPALGGTPAPPVGAGGKPKKPGEMAADDQTMMSDPAQMYAEFTKRLGAMEKKYAEDQKAKDAACMSAYSDRVDAVLKRNFKRVAPNKRAGRRAEGLRCFTHKLFAEVEGDAEKAFAAWAAEIEGAPESDKFSETVYDGPAAGGRRELSPFLQKMLRPDGVLARNTGVAKAVQKRLAAK